MKNHKSYFLFCGLLSLGLLAPRCLSSEAAYTIPRQIRYAFTLENTQNTPLEQGNLWVNVPLEQTATQWCLQVNPSEEAGWITNSFGNRVLHFKVAIPPYGSRVISIAADLKLAPIPQPLDGKFEIRNPKSGLSDKSETQSKITDLALRLKGANLAATARNIYKWIADNLKHSGYHKTDRGALWALENRKGDCSEFASLFAALCRAAGIPARTLSGFTCPRNLVLKPYSLHNWAEFHDGKTWVLADPLERNFATNQSMYIAFAVLDGGQAQSQSNGDLSADATPGTGNPEPENQGSAGAALDACPSSLFRYSGPGLVVKMNK